MAQYKGPAKEGQRVQHLTKKRERELEDAENRKIKLIDELKLNNIDKKFSTKVIDSVENNLKRSTVGLLTVSEMKGRQESALKLREMLILRNKEETIKSDAMKEKERKQKKFKQKQQIKGLSFCIEDENEDDSSSDTKNDLMTLNEPKKRLGKDPAVNTNFLPDIDREKAENELRESLVNEWHNKQMQIRNEPIQITYSYWDGSGHRRSIEMKKGNTIYQFLVKCLEDLRHEFHELKTVCADQLVYVKEDIIIPQTNTFYDFLITKARGKSGPLFHFDAIDDIRLVQDATIEKEDSHAGKIVLRSWYERNKHIFPASRWEPYDPTKSYAKYTYYDK